jgi:hypothetical protein
MPILGILASSKLGQPGPIAGYSLWLDANDATTFTYSSGTVVSQWNDKSPNGYNFTQATTSQQPVRQTNIQNGLPALNMHTGGVIRWMANSSYDFSSSAFTIFCVYDPNGGNFTTVAGRNLVGSVTLGSNANSINYAISRIGQATTASNLTVTGSNADVIVFKSAAGVSGGNLSADLYKNGTAGSSTLTVGITSAGDKFTIGATQNGSADHYQPDGYLCELIVYPSALSDTDRNSVEAYLKTKWGTP